MAVHSSSWCNKISSTQGIGWPRIGTWEVVTWTAHRIKLQGWSKIIIQISRIKTMFQSRLSSKREHRADSLQPLTHCKPKWWNWRRSRATSIRHGISMVIGNSHRTTETIVNQKQWRHTSLIPTRKGNHLGAFSRCHWKSCTVPPSRPRCSSRNPRAFHLACLLSTTCILWPWQARPCSSLKVATSCPTNQSTTTSL